MNILCLNIYFLVEIANKKYPNTVDNKDPVNTPILTPSIYCKLLANAKFPTNKLIVNPIPVRTETAYRDIQLELFGFCARFNLTDTYAKTNTPICFPKNKPHKIPNGTGLSNEFKLMPSKDTPAFANAKIGIMPKAT